MKNLGLDRYINRELSWLEFNYRVLQESRDSSLPILERLKYLSIFSSNLDEFFMVRVASLIDQIELDFLEQDPAGLTPPEQLKLISKRAHELVTLQYEIYRAELLKDLAAEGIELKRYDALSEKDREEADRYFTDFVFPVLTPMAVDRSRPFPLISSQSLNLCVFLENRLPSLTFKDSKDIRDIAKVKNSVKVDKNSAKEHLDKKTSAVIELEEVLPSQHDLAIVQVPQVLSRMVRLKGARKKKETLYIFLEDLIEQHIPDLFKGRSVLGIGAFRLTRNADLSVSDDDAEDLLLVIEKSLKTRKWGRVVRLEHDIRMDVLMLDHLKDAFHLKKSELYALDGPIDLTFGYWLAAQDRHKNQVLNKVCCVPRSDLLDNEDLLSKIREGDILLHHPYDSFSHVEDFIVHAAEDPDVLAIKMTLYRVGGRSRILDALAHAAEKGKQVTILLELRARFDEEKNIEWAKILERSGCHVIYGFPRMKTHAKIAMVVRKEAKQIRRYLHIGTGNYNDQTARLYTDLGLLTANETFGQDATDFFNMLSGFSDLVDMKALVAAPFTLRETIVRAIRREAQNAKKGKGGEIIMKMNALVDADVIFELYNASQAGVKIRLIVRGICSLRPGVPGVSETIEVISIVGEYLEHSRVLWFWNAGKPLIYLSSADMMPRNLDRRIELMTPVLDPEICNTLTELLEIYWKDTTKARVLKSDGSYEFREAKVKFYSQVLLGERAEKASQNKLDGTQKKNAIAKLK